jgi:hypothetical protein
VKLAKKEAKPAAAAAPPAKKTEAKTEKKAAPKKAAATVRLISDHSKPYTNIHLEDQGYHQEGASDKEDRHHQGLHQGCTQKDCCCREAQGQRW